MGDRCETSAGWNHFGFSLGSFGDQVGVALWAFCYHFLIGRAFLVQKPESPRALIPGTRCAACACQANDLAYALEWLIVLVVLPIIVNLLIIVFLAFWIVLLSFS